MSTHGSTIMDTRYDYESAVWPTKTRPRRATEYNVNNDAAPTFELLFYTQRSTRIMVHQEGDVVPPHRHVTRSSRAMFRRTLKVPRDLFLGDIDMLTIYMSPLWTSLNVPIEHQRSIVIKIHNEGMLMLGNYSSESSITGSPVLRIVVLIVAVTYMMSSTALEPDGANGCRATKSSVDALERMIIKENEFMDYDCVICMENFVAGGGVKVVKMPCSHVYHESCIKKWLEKRSPLCPLCRFAMPCIHSTQK